MKNNIAIIPARRGSKRLKNKNFLKYKNKHIIEHTIISAIKSKIFNKIILSTDSNLGKKIAKKYKIDLHWRPGKLSDSSAKINDLCLEIIDKLKISQLKNSNIAVLYATAPERNNKDIIKLYSLFKRKNANFGIGMTKFNFSPLQALKIEKEILKPLFKNLISQKKSSESKFYAGNGSMYLAKTKAFMKYKNFYGPKLIGYEMPLHKSIDIDSFEDYLNLKKINKL